MNLNGIGTLPGTLRPMHPEPRTRIDQGQTGQSLPAAAPTTVRPGREIVPAGDLNQTLPVEAPSGTDPELWSVLSSEERTFFAKVGSMGPLTYGHLLNSSQSDQPVMRGGRLDVKA